MLKIGQRVKFSNYVPRNIITNKPLTVSLDRKVRARGDGFRIKRTVLNNTTVHMGLNFIEGDILTGTFVSTFKKKITRIYNRSNPVMNASVTADPFERTPIFVQTDRDGRIQTINPVRNRPFRAYRIDRYSMDNPNRVDNPRQLDTLAIVKYKRVMVAVPIDNLMKHTYGREIHTI